MVLDESTCSEYAKVKECVVRYCGLGEVGGRCLSDEEISGLSEVITYLCQKQT